MPNIKVQIRGICCFADESNGMITKRVLLPYDDLNMKAMSSHIPFLEVAYSDVVRWTGAGPEKKYTKFNGAVEYLRWNLSGHCVEFEGVDVAAPPISTSDAFEKHVPEMKAICPTLLAYPRKECFDDDPPADVIAGCFEIQRGWLDAGPLEEIFTAFTPKMNWGPERTPMWVELRQPVKPGNVAITLRAFKTSHVDGARIELREGTEMITIGNLLEADISGPGSGAGRSEHFKLYYNLSDDDHKPQVMPVPAVPQVPSGACSPTKWN